MSEAISILKNAPVMNLFVLVGALLVLCAAIGGLPVFRRTKKMDTAGRVLCSGCGVAMLAAATVMFLGLRAAAARPPVDLTGSAVGSGPMGPAASAGGVPSPAPLMEGHPAAVAVQPHAGPGSAGKLLAIEAKKAAVVTAPAPVVQPTLAMSAVPVHTQALTSPEVYVEWGCEESKTASLSFSAPGGARLVAAEFDFIEIDKAKSYVRNGPILDPDGRSVSGEVTFRGLDKIFFNCPGGGHARVRLKMTVVTR